MMAVEKRTGGWAAALLGMTLAAVCATAQVAISVIVTHAAVTLPAACLRAIIRRSALSRRRS